MPIHHVAVVLEKAHPDLNPLKSKPTYTFPLSCQCWILYPSQGKAEQWRKQEKDWQYKCSVMHEMFPQGDLDLPSFKVLYYRKLSQDWEFTVTTYIEMSCTASCGHWWGFWEVAGSKMHVAGIKDK